MEIAYQDIAPANFEKLSSKKRLVNWIKDSHNKVFLGIFVLAIIIRIYYFSLTSNQPLWWDEADYLAYAKNLAGLESDWIVTAQHNSLYPFIIAGLFLLGLGEATIKFLLQIIPSMLSVALVYFISNEMYKDKRIGLIASFVMAVLWTILFNSMRFHVDIPGMFFGLLAIYVFWRGYENKKKIFGKINPNWAIPLAVFFVVLAYAIRRGHFLFGVFILVYMLLTTKDWKKFIKDKYNWFGLAIGLLVFFLVEKFLFYSGVGEVGATYFHPENKLSLVSLKVFSVFFSSGGFFKSIYFYLFLIGIIVVFVNLLFHLGYLKKNESRFARADFFVFLIILFTLANFIFILRVQGGFGEERWYFPLALGAFIAVSKGGLLIFDYLKKHSSAVATILVILLILIGGYFQIKQADNVTRSKISSFSGIRDASLYINEISSPEDIIISQPVPQTVYYSERKVLQPEHIANVTGSNYGMKEFLDGLKANPNAKYLLISFSEPGYPDWMKQQSSTLWYIPFMATVIDFSTGEQNVKSEMTYENIKFTLLEVKQDVFIYEVGR